MENAEHILTEHWDIFNVVRSRTCSRQAAVLQKLITEFGVFKTVSVSPYGN